jgi:hypothetical protein
MIKIWIAHIVGASTMAGRSVSGSDVYGWKRDFDVAQAKLDALNVAAASASASASAAAAAADHLSVGEGGLTDAHLEAIGQLTQLKKLTVKVRF